MDNIPQEVQQILSQMQPEELLGLIQLVAQARPLFEWLLSLSPEQLDQLAQQLQQGARQQAPEQPSSPKQAQANLYG